MQYLFDIETLLIFFNSRKQSGELITDLKRFPGIAYKGPCHVHITLVKGKVVSCIVQDQEGRLCVEGDNALGGLKKMGQLDWAWLVKAQSGTLPAPVQRDSRDVALLIHRRSIPIEMINRNALPRRHWQVLLLVDGSRTAAQIAMLLMPFPSSSDREEIVRILDDLQRRGIIVAIST